MIQNQKQGISLIAVLLFMLVATIASTATFKWLTSEGYSSASRLSVVEARQASRAGLEAARSWMMYHSNEVGAMIRQYYDNGKKPIKLNNVLGEMNSAKQSYTVWLTGVNTEQATSKLKITSVGTSNQKTKFSEVSILNVGGLYRVKIPHEEHGLGFDQAFSGKFGNATGNNELESGIINGDFKGNIPELGKNLMVTGSLTYEGSTKQGGDLFVKGDYSNQGTLVIGKPGVDSNIVYIGGSMKNCAGGSPMVIYGDLYVGGSIAANCKLYVTGNMTINGILNRSNDGHGLNVGKNLIFTDNAGWNQGESYDANGTANVNGTIISYPTMKVGINLLLPPSITIVNNAWDQNGSYNLDLSGSVWSYTSANMRLYQQNTPKKYGAFADNITASELESDSRKSKRYFSFTAADIGDRIIGSWNKNNSILKNIGSSYWERLARMDAYDQLIAENGEVPQPILLNDSAAWLNHLANSACKTAGYDVNKENRLSNDVVKAINDCYSHLQANNPSALYSGFLVVKVSNGQLNDVSTKLNGKIVLYFDSKPGDMRLPPTTNDAVVMLYLTKGASRFQLGGQQTDKHRYFVYSEGDIDYLLDKLDIQGSMIMANGSTFKDLNNGSLHYEATVLQGLSEAGIIKENPEYTRRANPAGLSGGSSGSSGSSEASEADVYFVGTAPQLSISLESQYKNDEINPETLKANEYTTIAPSVMVLPRVLYMVQDPIGYLGDYFNVLNLNGADEEKSASKVNCIPSLPTTSKLYDGSSLISEGIYECKYESEYGDMPFWVVVSGKNGATPIVHFEEPASREIDPPGMSVVNLVVPRSTRVGSMSVDVRVSNFPDNWILTPLSGVSKHGFSESSTTEQVFTVTFDADAGTIPIFTVQAPEYSQKVTTYFELVPPNDGCNIGAPSVFTVSVTGFATINRGDIPATYCLKNAKINSIDGTEYNCNDVAGGSWPSCSVDMQKGEWIYPYCNNLYKDVENQSWTCGTNLGIHLMNKAINKNCVAFIPDTSLEAEDGHAYTLFASLKRKRYTLTVGTTGAVDAEVVVKASPTADGSYTELEPYEIIDGKKMYHVYADYHVSVSAAPKDQFSNWKCSGESCGSRKIWANSTYDNLNVVGDVTLMGYYNERDGHCFFDSFEDIVNSKGTKESFKAFCPNGTYENCVDRCASETHCTVDEGKDPEANWTVVYANEKVCAKKVLGLCSKYEMTGFAAPSVYSDNFFSAPGELTSNLTEHYGPTVMLNRVKAGHNGTMTVKRRMPTKITTDIEKFLGKEDTYNDAFILRSNADASEYLSVNVYRQSTLTDRAMARVCYATSQDLGKGDDCLEANLKNNLNGDYVPISAIADFTIRTQLDDSKLTVMLSYFSILGGSEQQTGEVVFDLMNLQNTSLSSGKEGNEYVGLKMMNVFYQYRDMSWSSDDYSDSCFATPRIYCSFRNQYTGGIVPLKSDVQPWVGTSSWFDGQDNCSDVRYFYNGCDIDNSYYKSYSHFGYEGKSLSCSEYSGLGGFWNKGNQLNSSKYNFSTEGAHGVETKKTLWGDYELSGYAKSATVQIQCGTSTYEAECGTFYVGDVVACSENAKIYSAATSKYCAAGLDCAVNLAGDKIVNLRDARLLFKISGLDYGEAKISMVDKNGVVSTPHIVNASGSYILEVMDFADVDGFDPQSIVGVTLYGDDDFYVEFVESSCPNAPGLGGACTLRLDDVGKSFVIEAKNISNVDAAKPNGCVIENDQSYLNAITRNCPVDGRFVIPAKDFLENLNNGSAASLEVSFTVSMTDNNDNTTYCTTEPMEMKKSQTVCELSETESDGNPPEFKYYMTNCPRTGCDAKVELVGKSSNNVKYVHTCDEGACAYDSWSPANTVLSEGNYKYRLTPVAGVPCEKEFVVKKAASANVQNCRFEGTTFKAEVYKSNGGSYSARLVCIDGMGNTVVGTDPATFSSSTFSKTLTSAVPCTAHLFVDGNDVCNRPFSGVSSSSVQSSSSATSSSTGAIRADCAFSNLYTKANAELKVTNISGIDQNVTAQLTFGSVTTNVDCAQSGCWNNTFNVTMNPGTYSFSLKVNGATMCSGSAKVANNTNCAVNNANIELGESIEFKPNYAGDCWNAELSENGTNLYNYCMVTYTLTPETSGKHSYKFKLTGGSMGTADCNFDVVVKAASSSSTASSSGGGGSGTPMDANNAGDIGPGTYTITKCNGETGTKWIQLGGGSSANCLSWFSPQPSWGQGPWNTCNGQIHVGLPITFTVPNGGHINFANCWQ